MLWSMPGSVIGLPLRGFWVHEADSRMTSDDSSADSGHLLLMQQETPPVQLALVEPQREFLLYR